ncbi:exopolysaccharide biosynthesis protein [Arenimonas sp. GDDSR-1]|uniref:exopolysaccharide biosynthesis protein n=1 Tax=Arenimonas sp. GDDSR-1 TaxID=2950125 RepID=UPI00262F3EE2|nr:exopolysaccharide biosynthesis protein [Arenimonas sp. GDDSR-1]
MSHEISTRVLLQQLADGSPDDELTLEQLLDSFRHRSYGLFLMLVLIPVFIPIPAGQGALSGLLTTLIGAQMLWQMEHPWVPRFIGRKTFKRVHIINFQKHFDRWLGYIERLCKPRYEYAFDHAWARAFSGLLLVILGILLALPILGTNYPFGAIILAYSLGFIERDGILLGLGWILGLIEIVAAVVFSSLLIELTQKFIAYFT